MPDLGELINNIQNYSSQKSNDSGHVSTNNSDNEIDNDLENEQDNQIDDECIDECEEKMIKYLIYFKSMKNIFLFELQLKLVIRKDTEVEGISHHNWSILEKIKSTQRKDHLKVN